MKVFFLVVAWEGDLPILNASYKADWLDARQRAQHQIYLNHRKTEEVDNDSEVSHQANITDSHGKCLSL